MTSIVEVIQHYQRSIDSSQHNEARLLHCINKLYKLPIKVEHLQETGVGKTVNSLRKFNGEIGVAAKTLVTKWKAMVAAEEEPMDTTSQTNESETYNDDNDGERKTPHEDEDDENHNHKKTNRQEHRKDYSGNKKDKDRSSSNNSRQEDNKPSLSSSSLYHHNIEKYSKHSSNKHKSPSSPLIDKNSNQPKIITNSCSSSGNKEMEIEIDKTDHKSSGDRQKEKDHSKHKELSDKRKDEKSRTDKDKERKIESPPTHSSNNKSNSQTSGSSSSKYKNENNSKSKEKERSEKQKSLPKDTERSKNSKQSSTHSSLKDKSEYKSSSNSSTSKSTTKDSDNPTRKRRHDSEYETSDFKIPQSKVAKVHKSSSPQEVTEEEGSFDSSMGANFDDVLGMLNMPMKKKKKIKSPSTSASSSTSKKDEQKPSISNNGTNKVIDVKTSFSSSTSSSTSTSTAKATSMKLDLLAPTVKLEPLDPSIALELPAISTNYKPMPLNQTVMNCVFNTTSTSSKPVRTLTDAEAITHGISSKTIRTKIYSGVKTGQTFQVISLFDMCIRILQKNIDALEYTGGVPFEVLKPVLERATPQQLYAFEEYNPYLMEDSDVLWQQHVSRNHRTKKRLENESWREMFMRCQQEEERRLSVLRDSIKASQKMAAAPVRKTQLAFIDSLVKPPRNILKKQEQYGTKAKLVATPASRVPSLSNVTPNVAKTGDQRLKVSATVRDHAQVSSASIRPKKAPLMQKTLQFIRGRHRR